MTEVEWPEHAKLTQIAAQSQACYDFVQWLESEGIHLAMYLPTRDKEDEEDEPPTELVAYAPPMRELLARFFNIDQRKLEDEKLAMLARLRAAQDRG